MADFEETSVEVLGDDWPVRGGRPVGGRTRGGAQNRRQAPDMAGAGAL